MSFKDLIYTSEVLQALAPIVVAADAEPTGTDRKGWDGTLHLVNVGARGDTWSVAHYIDLILQHCDDDATWVAVTSADDIQFDGTVETIASGIIKKLDAAGDGSQIYEVGYIGPKRYSRIYLDFTGTHATGTVMGVLTINLGQKYAGAAGVTMLPAL